MIRPSEVPPDRRRRRKDVPGAAPGPKEDQDVRTMPIADVALSPRIINSLERASVILVEDVLDRDPELLMRIARFGEKSLREIYDALRKLGVKPTWRRPREPTRRRK